MASRAVSSWAARRIRWNKAFGIRSRAATARPIFRPISMPIRTVHMPPRRGQVCNAWAHCQPGKAASTDSDQHARAAGFAAADSTIRDCSQCPELVLIPSGNFNMGSTEVFPFEGPYTRCRSASRSISVEYEVTYDEWDACVMDRGCTYRPDDAGAGRGRRPVYRCRLERCKNLCRLAVAKNREDLPTANGK